jgi:hypothetical protein
MIMARTARRDFLKTSLGAAGALAWRGPAWAQAPRVRFGVIGIKRKSVDIAGRPGGHLFLVDNKSARYIDASDVGLRYGERLVDDVLNRTETANPQAQTFLAMEVALEAEKQARRIVRDPAAGSGKAA